MITNENSIENLKGMVEKHLSDDQFLVDIKFSSQAKNALINVYIDSDSGITIDECVKISRQIISGLEESSQFEEGFRLEVSSPGIDQPLKTPRQFRKNLGRKLKVWWKEQEVTGELSDIDKEGITLKQLPKGKKDRSAGQLIRVPFNEIIKSKVLVSFK